MRNRMVIPALAGACLIALLGCVQQNVTPSSSETARFIVPNLMDG